MATDPLRPRLYSMRELASIAGMSRVALADHIKRGNLRVTRVGPFLVAYAVDAEAWLNKRREQGLL